MIYVLFNRGLPVHVTTESPYTGTPKLKDFGVEYDEAKTTTDYKSFEEVEGLALRLTAMTGRQFLGFDNGGGTSHRYGVFEPPELGDEVSYSFNGDTYPCGVITKITPTWQITATDERGGIKKFRRAKKGSGWLMEGGTWWMVKGHIFEQNPSF